MGRGGRVGSIGTIEVIDPETRRDMDNDPMFKLEKTVTDEGRVRNQKDGNNNSIPGGGLLVLGI